MRAAALSVRVSLPKACSRSSSTLQSDDRRAMWTRSHAPPLTCTAESNSSSRLTNQLSSDGNRWRQVLKATISRGCNETRASRAGASVSSSVLRSIAGIAQATHERPGGVSASVTAQSATGSPKVSASR